MSRYALILAVATASACYSQPYDEPIMDGTDPGGFSKPSGPPRDYGVTVAATHQPPPISGGTLIVTRDDARVIAADSDRDAVYVVNTGTRTVEHTIALKQDDEPGRLIEDGKGLVHVVLRRAGAIATIDPLKGEVLARRTVCKVPRGIAYDDAIDKLHVACASGELVTMPTVGDAAPTVKNLGPDLRDVVVSDGKLVISRFRSADAIVLDRNGKELAHPRLRSVSFENGEIFDPAVAWRMRALPKRKSVVMVHQRGSAKTISTSAGGYGASTPCGGSIVHSAVSMINEDGSVQASAPIPGSVLPVDFAVSPDEQTIAVVNAGNEGESEATVEVFAMSVMLPPGSSSGTTPVSSFDCLEMKPFAPPPGHAIALAFDQSSRLIVQTREPAQISIYGYPPIRLGGKSVEDTGHKIFHLGATAGGNGLACASCHPEGGEDGRSWSFQGLGKRRTQTLRGGILQTAPFHWAGDETNMTALMNDVFAKRMQGGELRLDRIEALASWLDKVPAVPRLVPIESSAATRGKALFEGPADCSTCHNGALYTNHKTVDVGTGAPFQVPVLTGIRYRAPFMHDGCAATLLDRFKPECGGGDKHGKTSGLSPAQLGDIVAYLETL